MAVRAIIPVIQPPPARASVAPLPAHITPRSAPEPLVIGSPAPGPAERPALHLSGPAIHPAGREANGEAAARQKKRAPSAGPALCQDAGAERQARTAEPAMPPDRREPTVKPAALPDRREPSVKLAALPDRREPTVKPAALLDRRQPTVKPAALPDRREPSVKLASAQSVTRTARSATGRGILLDGAAVLAHSSERADPIQMLRVRLLRDDATPVKPRRARSKVLIAAALGGSTAALMVWLLLSLVK